MRIINSDIAGKTNRANLCLCCNAKLQLCAGDMKIKLRSKNVIYLQQGTNHMWSVSGIREIKQAKYS